jgi:hypothetical protein
VPFGQDMFFLQHSPYFVMIAVSFFVRNKVSFSARCRQSATPISDSHWWGEVRTWRRQRE